MGSLLIGSARSALRRGLECLQAGRQAEARAWLGRAHRLAPDDAPVRLLLASALAGADDRRCRGVLLSLLADYPGYREARIALSAVELRAGANAAAEAHLSDLLRTAAPPDSAEFHHLANRVSALAGAPGWMGADARGQVLIAIMAGSDPAMLTLRLDQEVVWSQRLPAGQAARIARTLPAHWTRASALTAEAGGRPLLGSGVDLANRRRVQGFVEVGFEGRVFGWAWHPADPEAVAVLSVILSDGANGEHRRWQIRADDETFQSSSEHGPVRARGFSVLIEQGQPGQTVRITGPAGDEVLGSPVYPFAECHATRAAALALGRRVQPGPAVDAWRPLLVRGPIVSRRTSVPQRRAVDVVIPVYQGAADFAACLDSLQPGWPEWARLLVVDDASPDAALRAELARGEAAGHFVLLRHDRNRGFPAAANSGMRFGLAEPKGGQAQRDVVLLNPDTLLPPTWLERLVAVGYAAADIGSVTPLTNRGTIVAYPMPNSDNPLLDLPETLRRDKAVRAANRHGRVEVPTAVGFCMFIRHDCLAEVGLFREDVFAQGYGEENDWCLRARHLGWRHVAATGLFVAHHGGGSFGAGRRHLLARNGEILERLHPGYDALIAEFATRDPLRAARFRADAQRWAERRRGRTAAGVLLITHAAGGGVERFVRERCADVRAAGRRPFLLRPIPNSQGPRPGPRTSYPQNAGAQGSGAQGSGQLLALDRTSPAGDPPTETHGCRLSEGYDDDFPNLRFDLPTEIDRLLKFLEAERLCEIEVHHLLGHAPEIMHVLERLALPYRVFVHDYACWCPRITLCTLGPRYCGEPLDASECDACVTDAGRRFGPDEPVERLRARSIRLLRDAADVVVSCDDVAVRMVRHFPGLPVRVAAWEDDAALADEYRLAASRARDQRGPPGGPTRVAVVGAIGEDKGYDVLLACVRDAARRRLDLSFVLIGYSMDDQRLLDSGPIFISGAFEEVEAVELVMAQHAHVGLIPSIWPETWCYSLSTLWRAGLKAVAFAFGAPAQRIVHNGLGQVVPVGSAAGQINDSLIRLAAEPSGE